MTVAWPGELAPSEAGAARAQRSRRQLRRRQRAEQLTVLVWMVVLTVALAVVLGFGWSQARRLTDQDTLGRSSPVPTLPGVRGA